MLFSMSNPLISLPNLMKEFKIYGDLSNLKINYAKSEAMGVRLSPPIQKAIQPNFNFKWVPAVLNYLGTYVPSNIGNTFTVNFIPLYNSVRSLLDKWQHGLHSWFGRCNTIKMCILPKFLYLFQTLPITIPVFFFHQISKLFSKFIWAKKSPRISRRVMTIPKCYGRVAVPDVFKYYQAAHMGRLVDWCRHGEFKQWVDMEQQLSPVPLRRAPWCYNELPPTLRKHPIIGPTL